MKTILLVDHDEEALGSLKESLESEKFHVETTNTSLDALYRIKNEKNIGCILVDEAMPRMSGVELASHLKHCCSTPVILMGSGTEYGTEVLFRANISGVIKKPIVASDVIQFLKANDLHQMEGGGGKRKLLRTQAKHQLILVKMFNGIEMVTAKLENISPGGLRISYQCDHISMSTVEFELIIDQNRRLSGSMHCRWQSTQNGHCIAGFEFDSITKHELASSPIFYELLH